MQPAIMAKSFIIIIISVDMALTIDPPEIPKSHIPVLDEILSKYVNFTTSYSNSVLDRLFGDMKEPTNDTTSNIDINVLDHNALKNIIEISKNKYSNESKRRLFEHAINIWAWHNEPLIEKLFELMRQSIYSVRLRLRSTKAIRIRFRDDISYNIAIAVGNVHQIMVKCDNLYDQSLMFPYFTFFLWPLMIYEKILAGSIDVSNLVQRAFMYHKNWKDKLALSLAQFAQSTGQTVDTNKNPFVSYHFATTGAPGARPTRPPNAPVKMPIPKHAYAQPSAKNAVYAPEG